MESKVRNVIPLKRKIIIYFTLVIVIIGIISAALVYSLARTYNQFNSIYLNLKTLDQYSTSIEQISLYLNKYLSENDRTYISIFSQEYEILKEKMNNTSLSFSNLNDRMLFENIANMVSAYGEESNVIINEFRKRDIKNSSDRFSHSQKLKSYIKSSINELTLNFIAQSREFQKELLNQMLILRTLIIILIIMSIILYLLFALYFSKAIARPIESLVLMAKRISKGNFDVQAVKISPFSELKILSDTFTSMSMALKNHVSDIKAKAEIENKLQQKEMENLKINALLQQAELKRLQAQINPHFLFNTLTTLHHTAFLEGATETCEITEAISKMLRHNLRNMDTVVTLGDEIEIIRNYVYIQQKRYKHRVTVNFDIDESLCGLQIPNMTIQPLVENAFIHGVENNEQMGEICIKVYSFLGDTMIEVSDNGIGMNNNRLQKLRNIISEEKGFQVHTSSIGITNIVQRLEAFYKQKDLVDIFSTEEKGTVIKLILPSLRSHIEEGGKQSMEVSI